MTNQKKNTKITNIIKNGFLTNVLQDTRRPTQILDMRFLHTHLLLRYKLNRQMLDAKSSTLIQDLWDGISWRYNSLESASL